LSPAVSELFRLRQGGRNRLFCSFWRQSRQNEQKEHPFLAAAGGKALSGRAEQPFYCFGFGSFAAKTKAKEVFFLAAAGGKALMRPASTPTAQVVLFRDMRIMP